MQRWAGSVCGISEGLIMPDQEWGLRETGHQSSFGAARQVSPNGKAAKSKRGHLCRSVSVC